ncbi:MAG: DUF4114 domain-containing protein [Candidatus Omnitrophica bacterium]|nr:DUF4114 domain-containing protein [Candidatus Omnitrophota bacterium]
MKKIAGFLIINILIIGAVLVFSGFDAFAYSVDWGTSSDDGRDGRAWLVDWLVDPSNGGYFSSDAAGRTAAWNYASSNYIDYTESNPFYFTGSVPTTYKIEQEVAGYAARNMMGYYLKPQGGGPYPHRTYGLIFNGWDDSDTPAKTFTATNDFGLYLYTPEIKIWYTDLYVNSNNSPQGLIYQLPDIHGDGTKEWLVAWEDLNYQSGSDRDFNDMYVKVSTVTPEPVSSALFILGGAALGIKRFRKKSV